jgi:hypothetical protein
MKKVFCMAIVALLAMSFTFTSCSKDEDGSDSLEGTRWSMSSSGNSIVLSFETAKLYKLEIYGPDVDDVAGIGTYTYSKPDVTLYDDEGDELYGTVNGNTLTLIIEGTGLILTKK